MYEVIKNLDLRTDEGIATAKQNAALDRMWDWPVFPRRPAKFISGEPISTYSWRVKATELTWYDELGMWEVTLLDGLEVVDGGSLIWRPWSRWNMPDNWPVYCLAVGMSILVGLIIGSYPWH